MILSPDLLSQFAKVTISESDINKKVDTTVYGTATEYNGGMYVKLDGSDRLTPVITTTDVKAGERVIVDIQKHTAIVTGNISSPAARTDDVKEIGSKISEFEIIVADKVSVKDLEAERARINTLVADNVVIRDQLTADKADIAELKADNVDISGKLTAHEASIEELTANKLDVNVATITYATIKDLQATDAEIHNLKATYGEFQELTAEKLKATTADITRLTAEKANIDLANVNNAWIVNGIIKEGAIGEATIHDGAITNVKIADATIDAAKIKSINADVIVAGTLKTERLIITDADGNESIVKAINIANGVPVAEVNGQKIQAASIDVVDLSAFQAKIAQFDMSLNAIYSGKTSVADPVGGIYLSTVGIGLGDGWLTDKKESPIQMYADGTLKLVGKNGSLYFNAVTGGLEINATSIELSSRSVATSDDVDQLRDEITTLLRIESSRGTAFKNDEVATVLSVVIYHGKQTVIDSQVMKKVFGPNSYLQWTYMEIGDETYKPIASDDIRLSKDGFSFALSSEDVDGKVTFKCELIV